MTWGLLRVINLANFALAFLGAYLTYQLATTLGLDPILTLVLIAPGFFAVGIALELGFLQLAEKASQVVKKLRPEIAVRLGRRRNLTPDLASGGSGEQQHDGPNNKKAKGAHGAHDTHSMVVGQFLSPGLFGWAIGRSPHVLNRR